MGVGMKTDMMPKATSIQDENGGAIFIVNRIRGFHKGGM